MNFIGVLALILITLKLCDLINWSWWLVLLPYYGGVVIILLVLIGMKLLGLSLSKNKIAEYKRAKLFNKIF